MVIFLPCAHGLDFWHHLIMCAWWVKKEEKAPEHQQRKREEEEADKVEFAPGWGDCTKLETF